jgi:hypothetical protein
MCNIGAENQPASKLVLFLVTDRSKKNVVGVAANLHPVLEGKVTSMTCVGKGPGKLVPCTADGLDVCFAVSSGFDGRVPSLILVRKNH